MPSLRAVLGERHHLGPVSVIRTVCSNWADRPPSLVRTVQPSRLLCTESLRAGVDHRLDREAQAGLEPLAAGFGRGDVRDRRRLVELPADAVADVFLDDAEAVLAGVADDRVADVADAAVGRRLSIASHRQSNAHCTTRRARSDGMPMMNVSLESPCQPLTIVVRSTLTMSPSLRT